MTRVVLRKHVDRVLHEASEKEGKPVGTIANDILQDHLNDLQLKTRRLEVGAQ